MSATRILRLLIACFIAAAASTASHAAEQPQFVRASDASFARPHDLVLSPDKQRLYVADVGNNRVKVLDPETLETLGSFGQGELRGPHDVDFDRDGRLLVADTNNDRIAIYELDGVSGRLVGAWHDGMSRPEGVALAPDGRVYATNVGFSNVVLIQDGKVVAQAGSRGDGPNQYSRPHDLAVGPGGRVFVSDPGNHRLQILDADLNHLDVIGGPPHDFNEPKYFDIDAHGWLTVADEFNNQIKIYDPDLNQVAVIGTGEQGMGPNRFYWPEGVETEGGRLWVSDTRNNRIVLYRLGSR